MISKALLKCFMLIPSNDLLDSKAPVISYYASTTTTSSPTSLLLAMTISNFGYYLFESVFCVLYILVHWNIDKLVQRNRYEINGYYFLQNLYYITMKILLRYDMYINT